MTLSRYRAIGYLTRIIALLCPCFIAGQNIVVRGVAEVDFAGRVIWLERSADYVTNQAIRESSDTIAADGSFELRMQSSITMPVRLCIDQLVARLYVRPDFVYGVRLPAIDRSKILDNAAEVPLPLILVGADSTELNMRIFDFREIYNRLFASGKYLSRASMFRLADSLQKICDTRFRNVHDDYFASYVRYSIASVNASVSRGEQFLISNYILHQPVQYRHSEYMQFFHACFTGYLDGMAAGKGGTSLYHIVNDKASFTQLDAFAKTSPFLANDTLRELVLLDNLWGFYFTGTFARESVRTIVSALRRSTSIAEHRAIADNMLAFMNSMQVGSDAPAFSAANRDGSSFNSSSLKGHWMYINFFSTSNTESLKEMLKLAALRPKYADKVAFVSICLDDSLQSYRKYLRENPKVNWLVLFNGPKAGSAKDNYHVTGTEAYFLVNSRGQLAQSPALSPSQGIEYRFNALFRIKTRTTKTGIR